MKHGSKRLVLIAIMSLVFDVYACMTTFVNNSSNDVGILNKNDETFMVIPKNGKRRFGSADTHAHFVVYVRQPNLKTPLFSALYDCKQKECGNGNVILPFSDIENNTGNAKLFMVIKNKPYTPMVRELPMIKKKNCSACSGE